MRTLSVLAAFLTLGFGLACGGGGGSSFKSPSFFSFHHGGDRYKFSSDTKVVWKWKNMSGPPMNGEWSRSGDEIVINWEEADNNFTRVSKLKQISECEMAQYYRKNNEGKEYTEDSELFVKQVPECTGRRR